MTHAECQELILDLAFGELDAPRAAEVEEHLAGCAECRKEREALAQVRRIAAPLRELEEVPPGFDDRILAAARAEAHHQHDGNVGEVVEVKGEVRPLGVEPARIDAHAPVKARPAEKRRPKWMVRAALGGSVAAAAALALVVSTSLETRRAAERASQAQSDDYRIRVKPATPEAVDSALRDAEANRERAPIPAPAPARASAQELEAAPQAQPSAALKKKQEEFAEPAPARKLEADRGARVEGSGGDAAESRVARRRDAPAPGSSSTVPVASEGKAAAAKGAAHPAAAAPPQAIASKEVNAASDAMAGSPAVSAPPPASAPKAQNRAIAQEAPAGAKTEAPAKDAAPPRTALELEGDAQQARHGGSYVMAASLYRSAARLRGRDDDPATAAWDLAHAVECLSAVARFDEARQVRDELQRLYPAQATALSAARRALREVDAPDSVPAAKQK